MAEYQFFQIQRRDSILVLSLRSGPFDRAAVAALGQELLDFAQREQPRGLIVDLQAVQQISSAALSKLMLLAKRLESQGGRLACCQAQGAVRELISLAWSSQSAAQTEAAALAALQDLPAEPSASREGQG